MVKKSGPVNNHRHTQPAPQPLTPEEWAAQQRVWEGRVRVRGPEAAIFHVGHSPEAFARLTAEQGALAFQHLDASASIPANGLLLDYGCGAGRWTRQLAARYQRQTVGVDLTPSLLEYAHNHAGGPLEEYKALQYGGVIPLADGSVSLVWAWTVLSAILDPRMLAVALEEWARVLAPDGVVCLIDNTSKVNGKPVRSPHSISRTVNEYQLLFRKWAPLARVAAFEDLGEINTIFIGRRR